MKVVVIGSGLAGTIAALAARKAGAEVVVVGGRPGASAFWSGVVEALGPAYDMVDYQAFRGGPYVHAAGRPPLENAAERFGRLLRRRRFHPYARLGLGVEQVIEICQQGMKLAALDIYWSHGATYVANAYGISRLVDGAAASICWGALTPDREYVVVGMKHYPVFDPELVAKQLEVQGLTAGFEWLDIPDASDAHTPATASLALETLDRGALEGLRRVAGHRQDGRLRLLPPILGRTPAAHSRIWNGLTNNGQSADVGELASVHKSLHGYRLQSGLTRALDEARITVKRSRVSGFQTSGSRIASLTIGDDEALEADSFVLATGNAIGGGLPREGRMEEPIFGLPLFLESAPIPAESVFPPAYLTRGLFEDQALLTLGIGVSDDLRPLDHATEEAYDNLYASGLVLGGTNFTRDGSAFGVALTTGVIAGRRAGGAA
jgi:anaerobic glycerol-3-phosphate dehydrogenase